MEQQKTIIITPTTKKVRLIDNTLEEWQGIVDGYVECINITDTLCLFVNEDGRLKNLPVSLLIKSEVRKLIIVGNAFFLANDEENEGETRGLTSEEEKALNKAIFKVDPSANWVFDVSIYEKEINRGK